MGCRLKDSPKGQKVRPKKTKQRVHLSLVDHGYLSRMLPSIKLMIIAKIEEQHTKQPTRKGKLEPTTISSCNQMYLHSQYTHIRHTHITQTCYDPSINTLRLDSSRYI